MEPFTEEQKRVLRTLAVLLDERHRRITVRLFALIAALAARRVVTLEEVESAMAPTEVELNLLETFDPSVRRWADLFGEGPREEKG
jgi:hypothetical protein